LASFVVLVAAAKNQNRCYRYFDSPPFDISRLRKFNISTKKTGGGVKMTGRSKIWTFFFFWITFRGFLKI